MNRTRYLEIGRQYVDREGAKCVELVDVCVEERGEDGAIEEGDSIAYQDRDGVEREYVVVRVL